MKILLIGKESGIGFLLASRLKKEGFEIITTSRRRENSDSIYLDLLDVDSFLKNAPIVDFVIILAAISKFRECRDNFYEANIINSEAPVKIAYHYSQFGAKIIFLSTSAVFDGKSPNVSPLKPQNARSEYGKMKASAEQALLRTSGNICILRFSKVIIEERNIFSKWRNQLVNGEVITCFKDQYISPFDSNLACDILVLLVKKFKNGIFQFSANFDMSYYEIAIELSKLLNIDKKKIKPILAIENQIYHEDIFRYTSLDSTRVLNEFDISAPLPIDFLDNLIKI
uniref:SDR family oxidoreductase n=1 Tax=Algoriphagus sp. TaxID=1872435 RepID=UPI004048BCAF